MIFSDSREVILTGRWLQGNSYRTSPTVRAETMSHSYESGRQAMAELGSKQPHELLLMLGGLLAVLLTLATYGIQWVTTPGIAQSQYATVATAVILNVVLGAALSGSSARSSPRQSRISPGPDTTEPTVSACRSKLPAEPFPFLDCFSSWLSLIRRAPPGANTRNHPKPGLFW